MRWVIWALMPALLASFTVFGVGALIVTVTSVLSCLFFEWFITRFILKRPSTLGDLSATITGLLLAFKNFSLRRGHFKGNRFPDLHHGVSVIYQYQPRDQKQQDDQRLFHAFSLFHFSESIGMNRPPCTLRPIKATYRTVLV